MVQQEHQQYYCEIYQEAQLLIVIIEIFLNVRLVTNLNTKK